MKAAIRLLIFTLFIAFGVTSQAQEIEWLSFEEAVEKSKKEPRKLLIDIYTDWCGWCKKMDREAYANEVIAEYINENYYAIKFDAEQREDIEFDGHTFKFVAQGKRGVHELAAALTNNKLSYPTTVFMDEKFQIIQPIPGYMNAKSLEPIITYIGEGLYKEKVAWQEYQKNFKSSL